jgi:tetratricopeptide (TPR) repeat protein
MTRDTRGTLLAALLFSLAALGVSRVQPRLALQIHALKDTDDVYPFPPPPVLRLATLGYVATATDVLWGKLLVENGVHWSEHRAFPDLEHYLDAIVELDPTYRPLYQYVDSLLCYRPMNGHEPEARETRAYLERGTRELPNDPEIWTKYGQFMAFMGPSYLNNEDERKAWKRLGASALMQAVDLGADMHLGIAASAMLDSRFGEHQTSVQFLERAYALAQDDTTREELSARLALARRELAGDSQVLHDIEQTDRQRAMVDVLQSRWRRDYPFLSLSAYLLFGPIPDRNHCAGSASATERECARDWGAILATLGPR